MLKGKKAYLTSWGSIAEVDIGESGRSSGEGKESKEPLHVDDLEEDDNPRMQK